MTRTDTMTRPQRLEVLDPFELGRVVAGWATDPASRPRTVAELHRQLEGLARLPGSIASFGFCEGAANHLAMRLPDAAALRADVARLSDPLRPVDYPIPQFYADHFSPGLAPVMTPLDMLYARIADQSLAPSG